VKQTKRGCNLKWTLCYPGLSHWILLGQLYSAADDITRIKIGLNCSINMGNIHKFRLQIIYLMLLAMRLINQCPPQEKNIGIGI
jgi:hypothetical protein